VPQLPNLKQTVASWTEATQSFVSDAAARGRRLPANVRQELRKRVNVLGLATKEDVELQSRIARKRMSVVLKDFTDSQRVHDQALIESLRAELREELQGLIQALDDEVLVDEPLDSLDSLEAIDGSRRRRTWPNLDDIDDPDDLDLLALDDLGLSED
jgi:hypothetical protein